MRPLLIALLVATAGCVSKPAPSIEPLQEIESPPGTPPADVNSGQFDHTLKGPGLIQRGPNPPLNTEDAPKGPPPSCTVTLTPLPVGAATLTDLAELRANVTVNGEPKSGELSVEFIDPKGYPFERRTFGWQRSSAFVMTHAESLLIAGTAIADEARSGIWTAHCYVDGKEAANAQFEVQP